MILTTLVTTFLLMAIHGRIKVSSVMTNTPITAKYWLKEFGVTFVAVAVILVGYCSSALMSRAKLEAKVKTVNDLLKDHFKDKE